MDQDEQQTCRYRYVFAYQKSTGDVGILELCAGMIVHLPEQCREFVETLCAVWNQEDESDIRAWKKLEQLDLDADPFVLGRQAVCIGAGCPFRKGTEAYDEFMRGQRLQRYL